MKLWIPVTDDDRPFEIKGIITANLNKICMGAPVTAEIDCRIHHTRGDQKFPVLIRQGTTDFQQLQDADFMMTQAKNVQKATKNAVEIAYDLVGYCQNLVTLSVTSTWSMNGQQKAKENKIVLQNQETVPSTEQNAYKEIIFALPQVSPLRVFHLGALQAEVPRVPHGTSELLLRILQNFPALAHRTLSFGEFPALYVPDLGVGVKEFFSNKVCTSAVLFCLLLSKPTLDDVQKVYQMNPRAVQESYDFLGQIFNTFRAALQGQCSNEILQFIYDKNPLREIHMNVWGYNTGNNPTSFTSNLPVLVQTGWALQHISLFFYPCEMPHHNLNLLLKALCLNNANNITSLKLDSITCFDWNMIHLSQNTLSASTPMYTSLKTLELQLPVNPTESFLTGLLTVCPLLTHFTLSLYPRGRNHDLDFISSLQHIGGPNLESISLTIRDYQLDPPHMEPIYELLRHNLAITELFLWSKRDYFAHMFMRFGHAAAFPIQKKVFELLKETNNYTLTKFYCGCKANPKMIQDDNQREVCQGLEHHLEMNHYGRKIVHNCNTTMATFVDLLCHARDKHSIQYGLLLENLSVWVAAGSMAHENDGNGGEDGGMDDGGVPCDYMNLDCGYTSLCWC